MINTAFVYLWGKRVGAVAWDKATGVGSFEYDPTFQQNNWDIAPMLMPISSTRGRIFSFPENANVSTFKGLPGLLADVLPDRYGNSLINAWLAQQGRPASSMSPVEVLCFIGKRGMGALEFEPVLQAANDRANKIEINDLVAIAQSILSSRENFETDLTEDEEAGLLEILKVGTSAGGARAKAVIAYNEQTGQVRSGQTAAPKGFKQWLIKFDGVTDSQFGASYGYGRVEMAYYRMAIDCGITMMESRLLEENDRAHFMTQRFDRLPDGEKLHIQSFCAMRHFDFNNVTSYSYEQLFETMRMLGLPYPQAEQLYRRMVFNVMARNCDDHTKNFAFTMDRTGKWALSPAYDVCHAYRPGSAWVSQHALSINGKRQNITKQDLLTVAQQMNVKKANAIIDEVSTIVSQWPQYAEQQAVDDKLSSAIAKTLVLL